MCSNHSKCNYCSKEISNAGSLKSHELCCKYNPERISHPRGNSGWKKGNKPWNYGKKVGRQPCWDTKYPLKTILVENSTYSRKRLRKRLIDNGILKYECAICKTGPHWNGNPMPLILDHINGINNDNRLENLRFVCSNCDSQLPTYKSRNIKKNKFKES